MKRDTRVLLLGLALWALSFALLTFVGLQRLHTNLSASAEATNRYFGVFGLSLLFAGSFIVFGAAISLCFRLEPAKKCMAGLAFLLPAGVVSLVSRLVVVHTYTWVFIIVPWMIALSCGAALLLAGFLHLIFSKPSA